MRFSDVINHAHQERREQARRVHQQHPRPKELQFTVFAKCSVAHFCSLNSVRNVTCGEWKGVASFATKAEAEAWVVAHRTEYKEYDKWNVGN
jgi:hypothetical protein